ncbi:MAG TPA: hypothetical protein VGR11_10510 [Solirubrobacteraceae bacterium]|nr:hypothetical protein [Solirubrobacteraceae bacterium]
MSSFLQYGSIARPGPAFRPVVIGALTCGALMVSAGPAQAGHVKMADGTLCPHAAGTLAPGETKAAPTVERAASSGPIGASTPAPRAAAPRPAAKPAAKAPVQRPAAQAQAQRPASSQAQAQRPAVAAQSAVSKARVAVPAQRQAAVAKPSRAKQPQAATSQRSASKQQVSSPAVKPAVTAEITTDRRSAIERPTATPATAGPADSGASVPVAILAGLFALFAIIVAGIVAVRRRVVRVKSVAPAPTFAESMDAAIEAELQEIIVETRARALQAPAGLEDEHDDREVSQTH